jgi:hypothetical protein
MENQQTKDQKVNLESIQRAKEKLTKLKDEINLDKPGTTEALLDAVASDLLASGLAEPMVGAPSLSEVLEKMREKVPDESIEAAKNLTYLLEEDWYDDTPGPEEKLEADRLVSVLYDKLIPFLDGYGQG